MLSLLIHAGLGLLTVAVFFQVNRYLYRRDWRGSDVTWLEGLYYVLAVGSVCVGWYYNVQYVMTYPDEASWQHFTAQLFTSAPACGSIGQDMIVTNGVMFLFWTVIDGPRRGLKGTWIYFTMSLFTSFGFAMGFYLAAQERQVRWLAAQRV